MNTQYIVVDDDPVNNQLCKYTLGKIFKGSEIKCFEFPAEGLKYIAEEYNLHPDARAVLFLDVNMPEINGWDFLEQFSKMGKAIVDQFTIYIVSSSIDPTDKERARANRLVKGYLKKPLSAQILSEL
ncbi:response regulator [soil metagenome]